MNMKSSYLYTPLENRGKKYKYLLLVSSIGLLLSACGGDGNADNSDGGGGTPALPNLTLDSPSVVEGDAGSTALTFTATLDKTDTADITVEFTSADVTAAAGSDYEANSGTITIPAGSTFATTDITVNGDSDVESDETFSLNLSNISSNATLGTTTATGTILNDDEEIVEPPTPSPSSLALNDTGVTACSSDFVSGLDCNSSSVGTDQYPGQDAEHGRDVTDNNDSDGAAGFSFTKLDSTGTALSDQTVDYLLSPWSCVQDQITGLMWEVKTDDDGLQDKGWTYSWYFRNSMNITGVSNSGECVDTQNCDTQKYMNAVNAIKLCGYDDWRVPNRRELMSIIHYGVDESPYIDINFFVNQHQSRSYWSITSSTVFHAFYVNFSSIGSHSITSFDDLALRLVRGGR